MLGAKVLDVGIGTGELDVNEVDGAEASDAGAAGRALTAGVVKRCRITRKDALMSWQQGLRPPQSISLQWELFQWINSTEYRRLFSICGTL